MRSMGVAMMVMWAACGGDGGRASLVCSAGQVPHNGFCVPGDGDVYVGDIDFDGVYPGDGATSSTTAGDTNAGDTNASDTGAPDGDIGAGDVLGDTTLTDDSATDTTLTDATSATDTVLDGDAPDTTLTDATVASDTTVSDTTSPSDTTTPPGPPCYGVPYEGCCAPNDTALFCYEGALQAQDCFEDGCGWAGAEVGYYCAGSGDDPSGHFVRACGPAAVAAVCACGEDRCKPDATCGEPCPCGPDAAFVARTLVFQHVDGATSLAVSDAPATPESGACDLAGNAAAAPKSSAAIRLGFVPNIDSAGGCTSATNIVATFDRWGITGNHLYSDDAETIAASWSWSGTACVVTLTIGFPGGNVWSRALTVAATPKFQCTAL